MEPITNDEIVLRHVPGGTAWQAPGPRITSGNFQIRHDRKETGVSITRQKITSPARLLELVGGDPQRGSRVAAAQVDAISAPGLAVVPKPLDEDPGHAEIQSDQASLDDHVCRKRLALAFQFLPQ
ncbi:MAG: hypothetical protein K2R98_10150 [Gemmataceae bacterium]|nr:hypothetical protein [Gemmataceae bacterium]